MKTILALALSLAFSSVCWAQKGGHPGGGHGGGHPQMIRPQSMQFNPYYRPNIYRPIAPQQNWQQHNDRINNQTFLPTRRPNQPVVFPQQNTAYLQHQRTFQNFNAAQKQAFFQQQCAFRFNNPLYRHACYQNNWLGFSRYCWYRPLNSWLYWSPIELCWYQYSLLQQIFIPIDRLTNEVLPPQDISETEVIPVMPLIP